MSERGRPVGDEDGGTGSTPGDEGADDEDRHGCELKKRGGEGKRRREERSGERLTRRDERRGEEKR